MNTSSLNLLKSPSTIVIAAGHGGTDPGAVNGTHKERDQAILIVNEMEKLLKLRGVNVVIAPHKDDTDVTISWINQRYRFGNAWVIEVHRDSASGLEMQDASLRCGIYTGTSSTSMEVGAFIRQSLLRHGAHSKTWSRKHTDSPHKSLGWIRQTNPAAHLLELAFMQGSNTPEHLMKLARIGAAALYEAFTGNVYSDAIVVAKAKSLVGAKTNSPATSKEKSAAELLTALADAYKKTDLAALFKKLKVSVRDEDIEEIKQATLAQWVLESGWASSKLAKEANNYAGLKYRSELKHLCTKYGYVDWAGEKDNYCKFANLNAFIVGYWTFLMRDVYRGWNERTGSASEFIDYLLDCGYTSSDTYLHEVLSLVPKATVLLG